VSDVVVRRILPVCRPFQSNNSQIFRLWEQTGSRPINTLCTFQRGKFDVSTDYDSDSEINSLSDNRGVYENRSDTGFSLTHRQQSELCLNDRRMFAKYS